MKSIKPGRGPSAMGGVASIGAGIFGVIWMIAASQMGAPTIFVMFGLVFVGMAIVQAIFHFKNATGKNRMSLFDITDGHAEPDPLDPYLNQSSHRKERNDPFQSTQSTYSGKVQYCPYCGNKVDASHTFCSNCGKQVRK